MSMYMIQVLMSVVVGAIAAGVLYSVRQQYHQPAPLKTIMTSTDCNTLKARAKFLYFAKLAAVLLVTASVLMLVWYSWYWPAEIGVVIVGVMLAQRFSFRLTQLEHTLYDLKRS